MLPDLTQTRSVLADGCFADVCLQTNYLCSRLGTAYLPEGQAIEPPAVVVGIVAS